MELLFDGYCPESLLKGQQVEMYLNEDDFWESEPTGLQIAVFPPFATILEWRGKGKLRNLRDKASSHFSGLVMAAPLNNGGRSFLPDDNRILGNAFNLEEFIHEVYASEEEYLQNQFDPKDPVFVGQTSILDRMPPTDVDILILLYKTAKPAVHCEPLSNSPHFDEFHKKLYDLKLVFNYNWMAWKEGRRKLEDPLTDYSCSSFLELSMYLTIIFRSDRFSEGTIDYFYDNGVLDKIFDALGRFGNMNRA